MVSVQSVTKLNPSYVKIQHQCCVHLGDRGYTEQYMERKMKVLRARNWDSTLCYHFATHTIDGKHYCTTHAGKLALKILEGMK